MFKTNLARHAANPFRAKMQKGEPPQLTISLITQKQSLKTGLPFTA